MNSREDEKIGDYLRTQATDGSHDSEGRFTLDAERAGLKASQHRFQGAEYVFKFLQASVAGGSRRFRMSVGVRSVEFSFENSALSEEVSRRVVRHLRHGIEGVSDEIKAVRLFQHEKPVELKSLNFQSSSSLKVRCERTAGLSNLLAIVSRANEHRILDSRVFFSPSLIELDGFPVPGGWQPPKGPAKFAFVDFQSPFYLAHAYLPASSALPGFFFPVSKVQPVLQLSEDPPANSLPRWCGAAVSVCSRLERMASVLFVADGVVLEEFRAPLGFPGLQVVLSAEGLETDLSTLRLAKNTKLQLRCQALLEHLPAIAGQIRGGSAGLLNHLDKPLFAGKGSLGTLNMQSDYSPGAVHTDPSLLKSFLPSKSMVVEAWPVQYG